MVISFSVANGVSARKFVPAFGTVQREQSTQGWWIVKKNVQKDHYCYKYKGWALAESDLQEALTFPSFLGVKLFLADGSIRTSTRRDWERNAAEPFQNAGFERQVALHEDFWRVTPPEKAAA